MSEKVLGFYEKDALRKGTVNDLKKGTCQSYEISKNKTFPVRLASESVDLKALKEFCKENYLPYNQDICNLIEWAKKEAKK